MITDHGYFAQTFNKYFANTVPSFAISCFLKNNNDLNSDDTDNTVIKFESHCSIVAIKKQVKANKIFIFHNFMIDKVNSVIKNLHTERNF